MGAAPQLQELVFGDPPLAVGHLGGPVLLGDDRLVLVKVQEHHAPQALPLATVRDRIVASLTKEQESQAALKAAQAGVKQLDGGSSFDAVAAQLKVSAEAAKFVSRAEAAVPAPVREAAFALPKPAAGKSEARAVTLPSGGAALFVVSAVRTAPKADAKAAAEARRDLAQRESDRLGNASMTAYVEEVRRTADVKKNPKVFD